MISNNEIIKLYVCNDNTVYITNAAQDVLASAKIMGTSLEENVKLDALRIDNGKQKLSPYRSIGHRTAEHGYLGSLTFGEIPEIGELVKPFKKRNAQCLSNPDYPALNEVKEVSGKDVNDLKQALIKYLTADEVDQVMGVYNECNVIDVDFEEIKDSEKKDGGVSKILFAGGATDIIIGN